MKRGDRSREKPLIRLFLSPPLTNPALDHDRVAQLLDYLAPAERQALETFKGKRYREYLQSRALLRHALSGTVSSAIAPHQWEISYQPDAPATLVSATALDWSCSLAHSRGQVAVALSSHGDCGIDLEAHRPRKNRPQLAETYFTSGEHCFLEQLSPSEQETAFYRLWTLKEAWYKADPQRSFSEVLGGLDFSRTSSESFTPGRLQAWWRELDGFSLAFVGPGQPTSLWQGWPGQKGTEIRNGFVSFQPVETLPACTPGSA